MSKKKKKKNNGGLGGLWFFGDPKKDIDFLNHVMGVDKYPGSDESSAQSTTTGVADSSTAANIGVSAGIGENLTEDYLDDIDSNAVYKTDAEDLAQSLGISYRQLKLIQEDNDELDQTQSDVIQDNVCGLQYGRDLYVGVAITDIREAIANFGRDNDEIKYMYARDVYDWVDDDDFKDVIYDIFDADTDSLRDEEVVEECKNEGLLSSSDFITLQEVYNLDLTDCLEDVLPTDLSEDEQEAWIADYVEANGESSIYDLVDEDYICSTDYVVTPIYTLKTRLVEHHMDQAEGRYLTKYTEFFGDEETVDYIIQQGLFNYSAWAESEPLESWEFLFKPDSCDYYIEGNYSVFLVWKNVFEYAFNRTHRRAIESFRDDDSWTIVHLDDFELSKEQIDCLVGTLAPQMRQLPSGYADFEFPALAEGQVTKVVVTPSADTSAKYGPKTTGLDDFDMIVNIIFNFDLYANDEFYSSAIVLDELEVYYDEAAELYNDFTIDSPLMPGISKYDRALLSLLGQMPEFAEQVVYVEQEAVELLIRKLNTKFKRKMLENIDRKLTENILLSARQKEELTDYGYEGLAGSECVVRPTEYGNTLWIDGAFDSVLPDSFSVEEHN